MRRAGTDASADRAPGGHGDRDAAEALRGEELLAPRAAAPSLELDEYWAEDLVGLRGRRRASRELGRCARCVALPVLRGARGRRPSASRSCATRSAPSTSRPAASRSTPSSWGIVMQLDVFTLFPEWFDWFREPAPRQQRARAGSRAAHAQPARAHAAQRRPGRRHAVRRRGRHGAARRRDGRRAARLLRRRPGGAANPAARDRADAGRPPARRPLRRRARRRARDHAAVRALRGLRRAHRPALRLRRAERSAATCSPAASWRRWSSPTRCCASCPARSATPSRRSRSPSAPALGGNPEYPHYTRPAEYRGWKVPDVLLSGHHEEIRTWRRARSQERGAGKRAP